MKKKPEVKIEQFYFTCKRLRVVLLNTACADSRKSSANFSCGIARSDVCRDCKDQENQQRNDRQSVEEYHAKVASELTVIEERTKQLPPYRQNRYR